MIESIAEIKIFRGVAFSIAALERRVIGLKLVPITMAGISIER